MMDSGHNFCGRSCVRLGRTRSLRPRRPVSRGVPVFPWSQPLRAKAADGIPIVPEVSGVRKNTFCLESDAFDSKSETFFLKWEAIYFRSDTFYLKSDAFYLKSEAFYLKSDAFFLKSEALSLKSDASRKIRRHSPPSGGRAPFYPTPAQAGTACRQ